MNQDQATMMTRITQQMEQIADKVNNNNTACNPERQANQGVPNSIGTTNTSNPVVYNVANLPATVRERYTKNDTVKIPSATEMEPFILPNPTGTNPNAITYSSHFVDRPRVITQNDSLFDLRNNDQSKSATRDKNFLATFPKLDGEQSHLVRKWYQEVLDHCTKLNISLHPYYLFRKEAGLEITYLTEIILPTMMKGICLLSA